MHEHMVSFGKNKFNLSTPSNQLIRLPNACKQVDREDHRTDYDYLPETGDYV